MRRRPGIQGLQRTQAARVSGDAIDRVLPIPPPPAHPDALEFTAARRISSGRWGSRSTGPSWN